MFDVRKRCKALLAGDPHELAASTLETNPRWPVICLVLFVLSSVVYGATFGLWRSGAQSICTAIKFPLVVLLTCGGNAVLNGCLAQVLDTGLSFRQSGIAILMSFTITSLVLAAFAPVMLFVFWNVPSIHSADARVGGGITVLAHVAVVAFAGVIGNHRLWHLLRRITGAAGKANTVLMAWLAGNLLLGSQISWILRPWVGTPGEPVSFFSNDPLKGNFFEAVWRSLQALLGQ